MSERDKPNAFIQHLDDVAAKPVKSSNFVERSYAITDNLQAVAAQLYNLSRAHRRLGMTVVAEELFDLAERLSPNIEALHSMVNDILDEQLAHVTGNNAAILRAVLGNVSG